MIIVAVESGTFEDDRRAASDLPLQRILPAFRTGFQMVFRHFLKFLKLISAACADIIVRWHFSFISSIKNVFKTSFYPSRTSKICAKSALNSIQNGPRRACVTHCLKRSFLCHTLPRSGSFPHLLRPASGKMPCPGNFSLGPEEINRREEHPGEFHASRRSILVRLKKSTFLIFSLEKQKTSAILLISRLGAELRQSGKRPFFSAGFEFSDSGRQFFYLRKRAEKRRDVFPGQGPLPLSRSSGETLVVRSTKQQNNEKPRSIESGQNNKKNPERIPSSSSEKNRPGGVSREESCATDFDRSSGSVCFTSFADTR